MEDFLTRERVALAALEDKVDNGMEVDQIATSPALSQDIYHSNSSSALPTPQSAQAYPQQPSSRVSPTAQLQSPVAGFSQMGLHSPSSSIGSQPPNRINHVRPETEVMRAWKVERARQIAEREAAAEAASRDRRAQAKRDLEQAQREWKARVSEQQEANRRAEAASPPSGGGDWDGGEPRHGPLRKEDIDWTRVIALLETLPKPSRDTSRLLATIKSVPTGDSK